MSESAGTDQRASRREEYHNLAQADRENLRARGKQQRTELRKKNKQIREQARVKARQQKCIQRWKGRMDEGSRRPSLLEKILRALAGFIFIGLVFGFCFLGGFLISKLLFSIFGMPSEVWANLSTGFFGIGIFAVIAASITKAMARRHLNDQRSFSSFKSLRETMDALNSIARGDFSVSVAVDEHDPFAELATSVNRMAAELDSAETTRQDFISNVSHEMQSPLTSITGFAALAKTKGISDEQREHYLDVIESESKRLSKLSDNLLKLSALESISEVEERQEFSLDKQIGHAVLMLEPQWAPKDIVFDIDLARIDYSGDEALLNQVWVNLLHNAVKFTPEGGIVRVEMVGITSPSEAASSDDAADAAAALYTEAGTDQSVAEEQNGRNPESDAAYSEVTVRVRNEGDPISPEDQIHLFERFYKADKSRDRSMGGNGLGLSLVKKIVELHGGTVVVESTLEEGTVFTVGLPVG